MVNGQTLEILQQHQQHLSRYVEQYTGELCFMNN